jgi:hypothetical protein
MIFWVKDGIANRKAGMDIKLNDWVSEPFASNLVSGIGY